jgi:hypothetical protein
MSTSNELNEDLLIELLINDVGGMIDFIGYIAADEMRIVTDNELGPGWRSRYSDWLRVGRPRGWNSSPGRNKIILLSTSSRPVLVPTKLHIQWVPAALSPRHEADHLPPVSALVKSSSIYTSTAPLRVHGVVLN